MRGKEKFFSGIEYQLKQSIRVFVRYEQPDEKGLSRRERNENVDQSSPDFEIPIDGRYIWDWYFEISDCLRRVEDGVCFPIPWSEYRAWEKVTGTIVSNDEHAILRSIDVDFCDEMNKELQAYQEREKERQRLEIEAAQKQTRGSAAHG